MGWGFCNSPEVTSVSTDRETLFMVNAVTSRCVNEDPESDKV